MHAEETQTNTGLNLEHDSQSGTESNAHADFKTTPEKLVRPSQARVQAHLANERTYLAWMRTAIALMGFGVVIVRLRALHPPMSPTPGNGWKLGLIFALVGLVTVLFSSQH